MTIVHVLNGKTTNEYATCYIKQNLALLIQEFGLNETDVIRVPSLFIDSEDGFAAGFGEGEGLPRHFTKPEEGGMVLLAFYPAAINGVVVGRSDISPQTFGPIINGVDIFQDAISQAYKKASMDLIFVDNFYLHHTSGGEIHCGTNTLRETAVKWW